MSRTMLEMIQLQTTSLRIRCKGWRGWIWLALDSSEDVMEQCARVSKALSELDLAVGLYCRLQLLASIIFPILAKR